MPGNNPVRLLVKTPVPVPSVVLELEIVGFAVVAQQVPLAVTAPPPSAVMFPPLVAVVCVIPVTAVVERVAKTGDTEFVLNVSSFP